MATGVAGSSDSEYIPLIDIDIKTTKADNMVGGAGGMNPYHSINVMKTSSQSYCAKLSDFCEVAL